ncbi:CDP-Glycerol:Poly(glycerophosphate) glycerophosphotransferase [Jatrophihabitans endophyticus]|uniref:CDP-Glycerol:Poly(Glycerophosphate) glycerophosphotransferase n=1 Tax=Jatrophihabitans endophyticus TaxID=1206085 RepID=A0A1M5I221_9ACTN|nr:DUF5941 domain-containing protein [Jatrophihabitans endophyticus]SHG22341.1 CDP-Glycerol:Poly(glycerophosphate) glycerophosphotransferase [Jatrophihabitans endophyticus]
MIVALVGGGPATRPRLRAQLDRLPDRVRARVTPVPAAPPAVVLRALADLARRAAENGEGIAVVPGDLVASDRLVLDVLDDPRATDRLLVSAAAPGPADGVRCAGAVVVGAASARHELGPAATHTSLATVAVTAADVATAAAAWDEAATVGARWEGDGAQLAVVALVRAGLPVTAVPAEPYVGARTPDALPTAQALDEDDLAWRQASRSGDGVWSTFVLRPISRRVSRRAVRAGLTPNQVTVVGFLLALTAAGLIAAGNVGTVVAGALLLQVSLVLDCVDGEIARSTRRFSSFGAWLDLATDRVKEYAVLAAVAVAGSDLWPLAVAAIGLQLTRHMADYAFADTVLALWRRAAPDTRPFADGTAPPAAASSGDRLGTPTGRGPVHWVKQAIHMQIGERWLVLSVGLLVGTVVGGPAVALVAYLTLVGAGLAWVLAGWALRTLTNPRRRTPLPPGPGRVVAALRDDGLLDRGRPARRPTAWVLPLLVTAAEGGMLLLGPLLADRDALSWAFAWAFVVAWHRYDVFYRARGGRTPVPRWVARAGGGWLVRLAVLVAGAATDQLGWLLPAGALYLALVYVPESLLRANPRATVPWRRPSLGVLRKSVRRAVAVPVARGLMRVTRPRRLALVAGLPDTEENSLVTAVALADRYPGAVVLVANDPARARVALDRVAALVGRPADRVRVVPKRGLATFRTFVRAELVCYTHGLYDSPRPVGRRLHVNLWHGTGPKWNANANFAQRIGAQAHSASSPLWGHEAIRALSLGADTRLVAGNPRQDVVAAARDRGRLAGLGLDPARPLVVWLPTFRSSRSAGLVGLHEGEPLTAAAGAAFAAAATRHGVQLVAKPHRLDSELFTSLGVRVLTDDDVDRAGMTLYELLGQAAGLLSDYSSGWLDLLDRDISIGLYVPDLETYRRERGLNRPDLGVAAGGLLLDAGDADDFFADVATGRVWHAAGRRACAERIELIDVAPGRRADRMLAELAQLAVDLFGDDLGLPAQREPATSS